MGRRRDSVATHRCGLCGHRLRAWKRLAGTWGGLPREVRKFLQIITDSMPVAEIEIVECSLPYESAEITRLNSTRVIWDVLAWQCSSAICRADRSREKYDWTR